MAAEIGWALMTICAAALVRDRLRLRARRELVARACHELRGPLAAATLAVHAAGRESELRRGRLAAVELELQRAAVAVDDLCGALWGRRRNAEREHVDVSSLIATQIEAWRATAQACGCDLRLAGSQRPLVVCGDRVRIAQATGNVLANALEHGRGRVDVGADVVAGRVRIEVSDHGAGLPRPIADLARRPRAGRGSRGRGLAIVSDIVARHGGHLTAGRGDAGAHVAIELPLAEPAGSESCPPATAASA